MQDIVALLPIRVGDAPASDQLAAPNQQFEGDAVPVKTDGEIIGLTFNMFTLHHAVKLRGQVHPVNALHTGTFGIAVEKLLDAFKIRRAQLIDNVLFHADSFAR